MEQSRGTVGIPTIDAFGPYRMPKKLFQYGLNEYGPGSGCPTGYTCNAPHGAGRRRAVDGRRPAPTSSSKYDIVLRIYAGYDETSVWQEFGEMKFKSKEDIPAEWGNPDTTKPRWVPTRYVPWTSWKAGAQQWGLSSVRQGESSGTITHEIAHFAFRTGDNNNNPYVTPYRRVGSGPVGRHGSRLVQRPRRTAPALGRAGERRRLDAGRLHAAQPHPLQVAAAGPGPPADPQRPGEVRLAVATVTARAVDPLPGEVAGLIVTLDGEAPQDRTPPCDMNADPLCAGDPVFNFYTMEVVQRIGYDSFTPDNGVLIAKNKDREGRTLRLQLLHVGDRRASGRHQAWSDFTQPDGTKVMRTVADYRQLNDALFHAGLRLRQPVRVERRAEPAALLRRRHVKRPASCPTWWGSGRSTAPARSAAECRSRRTMRSGPGARKTR